MIYVCIYVYHEFATELVSDVSTSIWLCDYSSASLTGQNSASLTDKILSSWINRHTFLFLSYFCPNRGVRIFEIFQGDLSNFPGNWKSSTNWQNIYRVWKNYATFHQEIINSTELRFSISQGRRQIDSTMIRFIFQPIFQSIVVLIEFVGEGV